MIWSRTFFVWCTQSDLQNKFREELEENIFACMEMSNQSYRDISFMPLQRFYNYLKWKSKLEEDRRNTIEEHAGNLNIGV